MATIIDTITNDKIQIDDVTRQFFNVFNNSNHKPLDWTTLYKICIDKIIIIKKTGLEDTVYDLASFIEPRNVILTNAH